MSVSGDVSVNQSAPVTRTPETVYYGVIGIFAILVGLAFWVASRKLTRLMGGVH